MPRSLAIKFRGKEGGVKLDPAAEVSGYLAEMQLAVVNTTTRLGKSSNIDALQGTLLIEKLKTGLLLDANAVNSSAAAAALRTAFYMDQQEPKLPAARPEKVINYSLEPEIGPGRSFILRGNFRFRDRSSSEFEGRV